VRTGIHHHGEQQTIAYVLKGVCVIRWGRKRNTQPARQPATSSTCPLDCFMKINPSASEAFRWVVVRSTPIPIVVNLPDDIWPSATANS
jgi:uncharacterized RmlC-like cupin family protein